MCWEVLESKRSLGVARRGTTGNNIPTYLAIVINPGETTIRGRGSAGAVETRLSCSYAEVTCYSRPERNSARIRGD